MNAAFASTRAPGQELSILVVEDSAPVVERLEEMLAGFGGVRVAAVVNAEADALKALAETTVDVVLLDLHLRQGTGFGVLRELAKRPHRPISIVFTNYDIAEYRRAANELGAEYFLDKAHDMDMLPGIIEEILAH